jgi:hypothetical protein
MAQSVARLSQRLRRQSSVAVVAESLSRLERLPGREILEIGRRPHVPCDDGGLVGEKQPLARLTSWPSHRKRDRPAHGCLSLVPHRAPVLSCERFFHRKVGYGAWAYCDNRLLCRNPTPPPARWSLASFGDLPSLPSGFVRRRTRTNGFVRRFIQLSTGFEAHAPNSVVRRFWRPGRADFSRPDLLCREGFGPTEVGSTRKPVRLSPPNSGHEPASFGAPQGPMASFGAAQGPVASFGALPSLPMASFGARGRSTRRALHRLPKPPLASFGAGEVASFGAAKWLRSARSNWLRSGKWERAGYVRRRFFSPATGHQPRATDYRPPSSACSGLPKSHWETKSHPHHPRITRDRPAIPATASRIPGHTRHHLPQPQRVFDRAITRYNRGATVTELLRGPGDTGVSFYPHCD